MFITFEGLDYCGKSTQAKLLAERFRKRGRVVTLLREPGGTMISEKVRAILLDKSNLNMTPKAELLLFSAARAQLVTEVIKPALSRGEIVICDRFYDSTTAYQGFGRGISIDEVTALNRIAVDGTTPRLTLFISIEIDEIFRRQIAREAAADRMELNGRHFFEHVKRGYDNLASTEADRFVVLDGMQPIEVIHERIWHHVQTRMT